MRVIAGSAKGRKLTAPKGYRTRPTLDRVKEAIFNTIAQYVPDARVLDLFAGTGSMGIEALSRGAIHCTFVEQWNEAIKHINRNIDQLTFKDKSIVVRGDVQKVLDNLVDIYDIVFLDPPYGEDILIPVLNKVNRVVSEAGIIVVETEIKFLLPLECDKFQLFKQSRYGDTQVGYYRS